MKKVGFYLSLLSCLVLAQYSQAADYGMQQAPQQQMYVNNPQDGQMMDGRGQQWDGRGQQNWDGRGQQNWDGRGQVYGGQHQLQAGEIDGSAGAPPEDHACGQPVDQACGDCYCLYCHYEPCCYYTCRCEQIPQYNYKKCCRYVPQNYCVTRCRYVPQYYQETCCRQVPEYYYTCECTYCPKYCYDKHTKYVPRYYYKHVCKPTCPAPCAPAPACCQ